MENQTKNFWSGFSLALLIVLVFACVQFAVIYFTQYVFGLIFTIISVYASLIVMFKFYQKHIAIWMIVFGVLSVALNFFAVIGGATLVIMGSSQDFWAGFAAICSIGVGNTGSYVQEFVDQAKIAFSHGCWLNLVGGLVGEVAFGLTLHSIKLKQPQTIENAKIVVSTKKSKPEKTKHKTVVEINEAKKVEAKPMHQEKPQTENTNISFENDAKILIKKLATIVKDFDENKVKEQFVVNIRDFRDNLYAKLTDKQKGELKGVALKFQNANNKHVKKACELLITKF